MAIIFLKDSKVSLNRYVGFKVYTIKTNKSLVIAEQEELCLIMQV